MKEFSQSSFARACGVSRQSINKDLKVGKLNSGPSGGVLDNANNRAYKDFTLRKKVHELLMHKHVVGGWSSLGIEVSHRRPFPLFLVAPSGEVIDLTELVPGSGNFVPDLETGKAIHKPTGQEYQLTLIYDSESPPPWLDIEDPPAGEQIARRHRSRAAKGSK